MCVESTCCLFLTGLREVADTLQVADDTGHVVNVLGVAVRTLLEVALVNGTTLVTYRIRNIEGEITIDGHSVKNEPMECKRVTAYIPDNPDLYENLTGIQYLNFVADIFGLSAAEREENIKKYADLFEITDSLGDLIGAYSHGMKQKVAIISALIHKPKLLVLDEPFVGLDPKATFTLKEIMHEMCLQGTAVFFSTHVLDVAEKLCNKVAIIKQGRIIFSGTMEELTEGQSLEEAFLEADNEK